jgi:hypothetical protein
MPRDIKRRDFIQLSTAGVALGLGWQSAMAFAAGPSGSKLISPGCRRSKVKVARIYLGYPRAGWPSPEMDLDEEIRSYKATFETLKGELADVEFVVDQLVASPEQLETLKDKLKEVDGILVIQLTIGIMSILREILAAGRPTVVFAVPYSGHDWAEYGRLQREPLGAKMEVMLTSDRKQLAAAIRPFRALHHLREAKILDVTTQLPAQYVEQIRGKFGTEIKQIELSRVVAAYNSIDDAQAREEAARWLREAVQVVEPSKEEVFRACKQALAFEKLLDEEDATGLTVDCYGTMWDKTIKLPAYPCLGFTRLNNLGFAGICESDLRSAMTFLLFQGLVGRPGFISDPTVDESQGSIILAHCLGTTKMLGTDKPACPYKLRTVHERQEGVVPQVKMPVGQHVTQAIFAGVDQILYFTGDVIDAPELNRGCRTKINVKVDGDIEKLWKNWSNGLHRVTCYGNLAKDLERFCRFAKVKLVNEAV